MPLTDIAIRNAKPREKAYKVADGKGLFIWIQPNGSKWWRYAYRFDGKQKTLALGIYPETGLGEAREKHLEARKALSNGDDPNEIKKDKRRERMLESENNFEAIAREWHKIKSSTWETRYSERVLRRLESDVFPKLGARPIRKISPPELLSVIRAIEAREALEVARRALKDCAHVFMFGIATGRNDQNPASGLEKALLPITTENFSHLKEDELPLFLNALDRYQGRKQHQLAVKLLMLTFVRTAELRGAVWGEIDFEKAQWRIPAERMKMKRPHIVPLSRQAVAILRELQEMNGSWPFVFPNPYRPVDRMSENGVLNVIYRMGYRQRTTGHGFRHTASTILNENGFNRDHIERQLAHVEANKVRGAYNHAEYLSSRTEMMQWWADYLDHARARCGEKNKSAA